MLPPLVPTKTVSPTKDYFDLTNAWVLAAVVGGILVLYSLSRIISLQRRIRDLEGRPPVDDIVMRGMIRHEVREIVEEQEEKRLVKAELFSATEAVKAPHVPKPDAEVVARDVVPTVIEPVEFEIKFEEKLDSPLESAVQLSDGIKVEIMPKKKVKKVMK